MGTESKAVQPPTVWQGKEHIHRQSCILYLEPASEDDYKFFDKKVISLWPWRKSKGSFLREMKKNDNQSTKSGKIYKTEG